MRRIMELADIANQYVNDEQPWVIAKQEGQDDNLQAICTNAINMFHLLMTYLAPVLPETAKASEAFLNAPLDWNKRAATPRESRHQQVQAADEPGGHGADRENAGRLQGRDARSDRTEPRHRQPILSPLRMK